MSLGNRHLGHDAFVRGRNLCSDPRLEIARPSPALGACLHGGPGGSGEGTVDADDTPRAGRGLGGRLINDHVAPSVVAGTRLQMRLACGAASADRCGTRRWGGRHI
jgi:hypothetical protein